MIGILTHYKCDYKAISQTLPELWWCYYTFKWDPNLPDQWVNVTGQPRGGPEQSSGERELNQDLGRNCFNVKIKLLWL